MTLAEVGGLPEVSLSRTVLDRTIICVGAIVFLSLSVLIFIRLLRARLGRLAEVLAVAGYLLAAAGARDLLGFSRSVGTSFLELLIVGIPLVMLAIGIGISMRRTEKRHP